MPEKNSFRCSKFSCRKKFTSDSWLLGNIKLHHPERLHAARQKILSICSAPRIVEPAQHRELNDKKDSVEDLAAFPYVKHSDNVADSESQPPPHLARMDIYPSTGAPQIECNAESLKRDAQGCLETNLPNIPYYLCATRDEYKYIECGIEKTVIKTYYDKVLKKEKTPLHYPSFKNRDGVQKLVASKPDEQALGEWEVHTLEDMRWNDNHQCPIKYWSRDIMKSMRWLMQQPPYTEHHIFAPQHC